MKRLLIKIGDQWFVIDLRTGAMTPERKKAK